MPTDDAMTLVIRPEGPADAPAIHAVTAAAFLTCRREYFLVRPFSGSVPGGVVTYHAAFGARS